ncbi:DUF4238 domain-containing protein [Nocardia takedensis]|uniref:DUF4238 domain-containing protein n=1 Tax=Nocardia takedensis TaxID=259390 RepID=UPI0005952EDB|nr:DUF4238 domain-containing protein [Nocardia takedensis]
MTCDHTVPRMYLKRWGVRRRQRYQLRAAPVQNLERAFITAVDNIAAEGDFYRGTTPDGVGNHDMESFFTKLETRATPAFRALLDWATLPTDNAFPNRWPARQDHREAIAWWLAAQILRTDHQRRRLWRQLEAANPPIAAPGVNEHLTYIAEMIQPLATVLYQRPWGFGWSDACLLTGDTPAVILNGHDADAQLLAASFWDIYLPLDSHRLLFLPGAAHIDNPRLGRDHIFKVHGGQAIALNDAVLDVAVRHVFSHPDHHPRTSAPDRRDRQRTRGESRYLLSYDTMPPIYGVERRWLDDHPAPTTTPHEPLSEQQLNSILQHLTTRMDHTQAAWEHLLAAGSAVAPDTGPDLEDAPQHVESVGTENGHAPDKPSSR